MTFFDKLESVLLMWAMGTLMIGCMLQNVKLLWAGAACLLGASLVYLLT